MSSPIVTRHVIVNAFAGGNRRPRAFARWLRDLGFDVALVCEADSRRMRYALRRVGTLFTGTASHGAREVAVVLRRPRRRPLQEVRHRTVQLTRFVSRPFAHDRWATRVREGNEVTWSLHGNAVIQGRVSGLWLSNPGAVEWREHGYPSIEELLGRDIERGRAVKAGGDMNADVGPAGGPSPAQLFGALGLHTVHAGYMWFAFSGRHYKLVDWQILDTPPGADAHRVLVVDLEHRPSPNQPTREKETA